MGDPVEVVAAGARSALVELAARGTGAELEQVVALAAGPDPELATHAARVLVDLEHADAWSLLVARLADPSVPLLLRDEVHVFLTEANGGEGLDYDAFAEPMQNAGPLEAWREWAAGR